MTGAGPAGSEAELLYLGCFGDRRDAGQGITVARRDPRTGKLTLPRLAAPADSPAFLAHHPHRPVLYAACQPAAGGEGLVAAWAIISGGDLRSLGDAGTGGDRPCHLTVHPSGQFVLTANYGSGSVAVHRLAPAGSPAERTDLVVHSGRGPHPDRQERSHPHMVAVDPAGDGVHVVDLGADAVFHYRLDVGSGRLEPTGATRTAPGTGPRHVAQHRQWRYLVGELDGTLTSYQVAGVGGEWRRCDQVPICADGAEGMASEVAASADGRFVYAATRGPDRIAAFAADAGQLRRLAEVPCGGHWPRHLALVGSHLYVANERSHTVVTFHVDPHTGIPAPTGDQLKTPSPSCILPPPMVGSMTP